IKPVDKEDVDVVAGAERRQLTRLDPLGTRRRYRVQMTTSTRPRQSRRQQPAPQPPISLSGHRAPPSLAVKSPRAARGASLPTRPGADLSEFRHPTESSVPLLFSAPPAQGLKGKRRSRRLGRSGESGCEGRNRDRDGKGCARNSFTSPKRQRRTEYPISALAL